MFLDMSMYKSLVSKNCLRIKLFFTVLLQKKPRLIDLRFPITALATTMCVSELLCSMSPCIF